MTKIENIVTKEEIARFGQFLFCHYVFKKPSATEASESIYMRERVNTLMCSMISNCKIFNIINCANMQCSVSELKYCNLLWPQVCSKEGHLALYSSPEQYGQVAFLLFILKSEQHFQRRWIFNFCDFTQFLIPPDSHVFHSSSMA